jgi:hypothetical protein
MSGKHHRLERLAVNTLRLLSALFARLALRRGASAFATFLPPLLRPLLDLLRPPGCAHPLCTEVSGPEMGSSENIIIVELQGALNPVQIPTDLNASWQRVRQGH